MRVRINGQNWCVREAEIDDYGRCYHSERLIEIRTGQKPYERMDTLLHEALHAAKPRLSESEVDRLAGVLSEVLWKDGYRKT